MMIGYLTDTKTAKKLIKLDAIKHTFGFQEPQHLKFAFKNRPVLFQKSTCGYTHIKRRNFIINHQKIISALSFYYVEGKDIQRILKLNQNNFMQCRFDYTVHMGNLTIHILTND